MRDAHDKDQLHQRKIRFIVNCAKETKNYHHNDATFMYYNANLVDIDEQHIHMDPAIDFIGNDTTFEMNQQ